MDECKRFELTGSVCVCVCVCFIPFFLDVRLVDVPAGVTQEEGHTGFSHPFPSWTVKSNLVYQRINRSLLVGHDFELLLI